MSEQFEKYIDTFTENLLNSTRRGNTDCKKIYVIKHYNTFNIYGDDIAHRAQTSPNVYFHDFYGSEMTDAYEPFLGFIKDMYNKYYVHNSNYKTIDDFLEECGVYPLHYSIFTSYITDGVCKRYEDLLLGEAEYEHERILEDFQKIIKTITDEYTVLMYINNINKAPKSTIELLKKIYDSRNNNGLLIFAAYNELHAVLPHMTEAWESFVETLQSDDCIIDSVFSEQLNVSTSSGFRFSSSEVPTYLNRLTNMFYCLDYDQFHYYMRIIYQKMEMETLSVEKEHRFRLLRLFATYSIYSEDISNALLLSDALYEIYHEANTYETGYTYYYLACLTQLYNGKHSKAKSHALACLRLATDAEDEFSIFKSKLLSVMVKMSGWHNLLFCNEDVAIDENFLYLAEYYHYTNHLAHTYIFAFENRRDLFTVDVSCIEDQLIYFNKGIELAKKLGNQQLLMEAYRKNIMLSSSCGAFEISNYFYEKSHKLVGDSDPFAEADLYKGWGYNCCGTEQYQTAHDYYSKALQICYKLDMVDQIGEVLYNMAINCILAEDYNYAYAYLQTSLKIVNALHLNDLRICNISKLFGLLALCSYRLGNAYNCQLYLDSTGQFLTHILYRDTGLNIPSNGIDPSFTACDDDLFLYHYVNALVAKDNGDFTKSLEYFHKAEVYVMRSEGNQFFSYVQYKLSLAELYRSINNENSAMAEYQDALNYCEKKNHSIHTQKVTAAMTGKTFHPIKYKLVLDSVSLDDINTLTKQTALKKNYEATKRQLEFLNTWQKITDITNKSRHSLIDTALNTISTTYNVDAIVYIKYRDGVPSVEFNNSFTKLDEENLGILTEYFNNHRSGFVTSKMRKNFNEFKTVISIFGTHNICSIVCIPFFVNEKLDNLFINCIYMKYNWSSVINKYMLDESDLNIFSIAYRQLVNALEMLEKQKRIKEVNLQLENAAITDYLTSLLNRDGFYSNVSRLIDNAVATGERLDLSILYIDLDNFKYYNDTFGHDVGDLILKNIAAILKRATGSTGFAVRFGGDEFLIVLKTASSSIASDTAKNILSSIHSNKGYEAEISSFLNRSVSIPENKAVSASIGIAVVPDVKCLDDISNALKCADSTLYQIKHTTKNNYMVADTKI